MLETDPELIRPADPVHDGKKILQRADVVWSRMRLEPDEVLLVKISKHMSDYVNDIKEVIDICFGKDNTKVLLYVDEDIEFTKVKMK